MQNRERIAWCLFVAILVSAGCLTAREFARPELAQAEFQRAVGGLGTGPAQQLDACGQAFDCRVCPVCELMFSPIPGAGMLCHQHAGFVFDLSDQELIE